MSRVAFLIAAGLVACSSPPPPSDSAPAPAPVPVPDSAPAPAALPSAEVVLDGRGDITALAHDGDTLYWIESSDTDGGVVYRLAAGATSPSQLAREPRGLELLCVYRGEVFVSLPRGRDRRDIYRVAGGALHRHAWSTYGVAVGIGGLACDAERIYWTAISPGDSGPLVAASRRRGGRAHVLHEVEPDGPWRTIFGVHDGHVVHELGDDILRTPVGGGATVAAPGAEAALTVPYEVRAGVLYRRPPGGELVEIAHADDACRAGDAPIVAVPGGVVWAACGRLLRHRDVTKP